MTRPTIPWGALALCALSACAGSADGSSDAATDADGSSTSDAPGCMVHLAFDPPAPQVGVDPVLRVIASADSSGVTGYSWSVSHAGANVVYEYAQPDTQRAIRFPIPEAGIYHVHVDVPSCNSDDADITVAVPMAATADYRLRVLPPPALGVPSAERVQRIFGGGDATVAITLDPGIAVSLRVRDGSTPAAAYLQLAPVGAAGAVSEAFTDGTGNTSAVLLPQSYSVLVVPVSQNLAPRRIATWNATTAATLAVSAGQAIAGSVRAPDGSPIAGASVQLTIDGVPTTFALTGAAGDFAVRSAATTGADVSIAITAPAATGLPKLVAHVPGAQLDLAQPLAVTYASTLVTRDLAGLVVTRGAPLAGAQVVVTGTIAMAGAVQAGAVAVPVAGEVRAVATANASGVLPATRVPAALLSAVIVAAPGDVAVETIDTSTVVPAQLAARPMVAVSTSILDAAGVPLPGADGELVPRDALASASTAPIHLVADGAGMLRGMLAAGGAYQLRLRDPQGRGGAVTALVATGGLAASYALPHALKLQGRLEVSGSPTPIDRATVQLLCMLCTGVERDRPVAETTSDHGTFLLSVPDPGVP